MFASRIALAGALMLLAALPATAQPYARGALPPVGGPTISRSYPSVSPGYLGIRTPGVLFGLSFGFGVDYFSGYYYRPTPDLGYYYLNNYYPNPATQTLRTPLSLPAPAVAPLPNLAAPSMATPGYTYPDLINPLSNPTIRPKK